MRAGLRRAVLIAKLLFSSLCLVVLLVRLSVGDEFGLVDDDGVRDPVVHQLSVLAASGAYTAHRRKEKKNSEHG